MDYLHMFDNLNLDGKSYIHAFEEESEFFDTYYGDGYYEPWLSYTEETKKVKYNKTLRETYLTFEILSDGVIKWKTTNSGLTRTIEYKKNAGEWTSITSTTGGTNIDVASGDVVQFRGDNATYATGTSAYNTFSGTTASFNLKGNIMSLIDSNDFANITALTGSYTFCDLFYECTGLTTASKLVLPATALTNNCYYQMFSGCASLTTAPELPATTLAGRCYADMFARCTHLTTSPELPATELANYCYYSMFSDCTSLTTVPELPATTLVDSCYRDMFSNCRAITTSPELPSATLANYCYADMFNSCTSLTTPPSLPATTLTEGCYYQMFRGCTALTTTLELPATTLAYACYANMFSNTNVLPDCTHIDFTNPTTVASRGFYGFFGGTKVTDSDLFNILPSQNGRYYLPCTVLNEGCYEQMFNNCKNLVTPPDLPATNLPTSCYKHMFSGCTGLLSTPQMTSPEMRLGSACCAYMFNGCTSLTNAGNLSFPIVISECFYNMFNGCVSLTTPPSLPATTLAQSCYYGMFNGCTSLASAPELPATTLVQNCYHSMFNRCTSLNYIKCLATNISASNCTYNWVNGVASNGTFVKNASMSSWTTGVNGIPSGWAVQDAS